MRQSEVITWYSRRDVATELVRVGQDREVAHIYRQGGYGKRPAILQFPTDVKSLARQGATSFHISEERWSNPMSLKSDITDREITDLRNNWDLVIDIDCPIFDYSRIAADVIVEALKFHGIKNPSVKFSGNRGWHIGVLGEVFPSKVGKKDFKDLFPVAAAAIISYLKDFTQEQIKERVLRYEGDVKNILKTLGKENSKNSEVDFSALSGVDIQLSSVRHLIRAPYSLHEKTWLVSLPIKPDKILKFKKEDAHVSKIKDVKDIFFNSDLIGDDDGRQLLIQSLDWSETGPEKTGKKEYEEIEGRISEKFFPPCINFILKGGMPDGRKRALFALINFLRMMNWSMDEIEEKVREWNSTNSPPLKEGYVRSQLSWQRRQHKKFPPPNCGDFYYSIGLSGGTCKDHKNPVSYAVRKVRSKQ